MDIVYMYSLAQKLLPLVPKFFPNSDLSKKASDYQSIFNLIEKVGGIQTFTNFLHNQNNPADSNVSHKEFKDINNINNLPPIDSLKKVAN